MRTTYLVCYDIADAKRLREQGGEGIVVLDVPPDLLAALRAEVEALRRELLGMGGSP